MRGQNFTYIPPSGNTNKTKTNKPYKPARHLASER